MSSEEELKFLKSVQYVSENLELFHNWGIDVEQMKNLLTYIERLQGAIRFTGFFADELVEEIDRLKKRAKSLRIKGELIW